MTTESKETDQARAVKRAIRRLRWIAEQYGPGFSLSITDTNYLLALLDHVEATQPESVR